MSAENLGSFSFWAKKSFPFRPAYGTKEIGPASDAQPGRWELDGLLGGVIRFAGTNDLYLISSPPSRRLPRISSVPETGSRWSSVQAVMSGNHPEPQRSSLVAQAAGSGPAMVVTTRNKWTLWARRRTSDPGQHGGPGSRKHGSSPVQRGRPEALGQTDGSLWTDDKPPPESMDYRIVLSRRGK